MIYTIGHSTQSIEDFYELLLHYNIDCIIDIMSSPYSQHAPQFNRENLKDFLSRKNILYAHFGDEFGARRTDCLCPVIKTGKEVEQVLRFFGGSVDLKANNPPEDVYRIRR